MEEKFSSKAEEMKSTIKETIDNAKSSLIEQKIQMLKKQQLWKNLKVISYITKHKKGTIVPFFYALKFTLVIKKLRL